ncbi:MAG: potassium channel family protein [Boseongicola sp.]|nr:potassium channel family protein [Boseongicola sp.]
MKISRWIVRLARWYYWYALCLSVIVAILANPTTESWLVLLSQGSAFVVLVVYGTALLLRPEGVHRGQLVGLVVLAVLVSIICHGLIYSKVGLVSTAVGKVVQPDLVDGLYFSIVTFTTLGYGDFVPRDGYRLVSALQALYGYLFLGSLVGLVVGTVVNRQKVSYQKTSMYVATPAMMEPTPNIGRMILSTVESIFTFRDHQSKMRRWVSSVM